jgi:hypothetical protein
MLGRGASPYPLHFFDFCLSDFSIGMVITLWSVVSPW